MHLYLAFNLKHFQTNGRGSFETNLEKILLRHLKILPLRPEKTYYLISMLLLKNVTIIAPFSDLNGQLTDIFINKSGIIEKIGTLSSVPKNTTIFEKEGTCVSIGWADIGVHTCDPGFEHREDLASTARAAMAGGFTTVMPFPNTEPATDSKAEILYIKNKTQSYLVDFYPIGALSAGCKGKDLAELIDMSQAGAVAFSDGKKAVQDGGLILRGLQYAKTFEGIIFNSPLDKTIAPHGQMHEGLTSTSLGLSGIPSMAEELIIQRDLQLLEYSGGRLHFHNISTSRSVELIRQAKKQGLKVTCSVAALNLCLNDEALNGFDTYLKVMPPLREKSDIDVLIKGLKDGTIDFIDSNHTPIDTEGKDLEFPYAAFGAIGLDSAFSMIHTQLSKKLTFDQLIHLWAIQPRTVLGLPVPSITEGVVANFTLFNPHEKWAFTEKNIYSKSRNTPLLSQPSLSELKGRVYGVINKGQYWIRD